MKLAAFLVLLLVQLHLVWASSAKCSFLGTWDGRKCTCEEGWVSSDCSKLALEVMKEEPASYYAGVHDPEYPTFGGNIYLSDLTECGGDKKYYWVGQTQGNRAGMSCWAHNSAGSVWESTSDSPMGPWRFVSWFGFGTNTLGFAPTAIPWLGNFRFTIETKLQPGATSLEGARYAFVTYSKAQKRPSGFHVTSFAEPSRIECDGPLGLKARVNPFNKKVASEKAFQVFAVAYKELQSTSECPLRREIRGVLDSKEYVENLNGYERSGYVNTELTWRFLLDRIPKMPKSDNNPVNPAPLYENGHGLIQYNGDHIWPVATGMSKGMYYRPMFIRWNNPRKKFVEREKLAVMAVRADVFIWDDHSPSYFINQRVGPRYYEDPWAFVTEHGIHLWTHDIAGCPYYMHDACGGSLHLGNADLDSLMFENKWVDKPLVFKNKIPALRTRLFVRQRPALFFEHGKPQLLLTGNIWQGGYWKHGEWNSKTGATRCFAHRVTVSQPPTAPTTRRPTIPPPTRQPTPPTTLAPTLAPSTKPTRTPVLDTICLPKIGTTNKKCRKKLRYCKSIGAKMKWVKVTKCKVGGKRRVDGGCLTADHCEYKCGKVACDKDSKCVWRNEGECVLK